MIQQQLLQNDHPDKKLATRTYKISSAERYSKETTTFRSNTQVAGVWALDKQDKKKDNLFAQAQFYSAGSTLLSNDYVTTVTSTCTACHNRK